MPNSPVSLTGAELDELRAELERQLARLRRSMKTTEAAARPVELDPCAVGRLSRMDEMQNQHLTQNLQARGEARLGALEEALERLDAGGYGGCDACGLPIAFDRLFIVPEATECGRCT